jgi:MSHA biogenesis protein MshP
MSIMRRNSRHQRGFTLVWALFLVVIGALIVQFMLRMIAVQAGGNDLSLQGARAWQAANAGAEWGVRQATAGSCVGSSTVTLGSESDLAGFAITVGCTASLYSEGGVNNVTMYHITSTAQKGSFGISPDYAYRQVQVTVARQP